MINPEVQGYTVSEMMLCCVAREVKNGEFLGQGIATPMISAGYLLAKMTHAPDVYAGYPVGNAISKEVAPVALSTFEDFSLGKALKKVSYVQIICDFGPRLDVLEFFRPAQIDKFGHFNTVVIGDYARPKVRLIGPVGLSDVTPYRQRIHLYVTRHTKEIFVDKVDFISGLAICPPLRTTATLISDLGVFRFTERGMALETIHPGVTPREVQENTSFPVELPSGVGETPPPTEEHLRLIREVIDPLGIRELEILTGEERNKKIREIYRKEQELKGSKL